MTETDATDTTVADKNPATPPVVSPERSARRQFLWGLTFMVTGALLATYGENLITGHD